MATTSQFRIYTNNDSGAPQLTGFSGSIINVLNWCLITGSGWLQPSASIINSRGDFQQAIYQQPSGSGCILYVNDAWPNVTATGKEAWATGWECVSSMTAPVGTGSGQFPRTEQLLTTGHFVIRKNLNATAVAIPWIMYADAYTFYFFNQSEASTVYSSTFFGDFYTFNSVTDPKHCFLSGQVSENLAVAANNNSNDLISGPVTLTLLGAPAGGGGSTPRIGASRNACWIYKMGDFSKAAISGIGNTYYPMYGNIPFPNSIDTNLYLCPLSVWQGGMYGGMMRGRYRGLYHCVHPSVNFVDGQIISGSNEYSGKAFQIVKLGPNNGFWTIEISPTLETN